MTEPSRALVEEAKDVPTGRKCACGVALVNHASHIDSYAGINATEEWCVCGTWTCGGCSPYIHADCGRDGTWRKGAFVPQLCPEPMHPSAEYAFEFVERYISDRKLAAESAQKGEPE